MRSPQSADPSTKDRIRDAALERFGRDGFGASLRAIAADAGVSAALIVKLFGTKEHLREECDEHVLTVIRENKREVMTGTDLPRSFMEQIALMEEYQPLVRYLSRSFMTGGTAARGLVEHLIADAVEYSRDAVAQGNIVPSRNEAARVRYLVGASIGNWMLAFLTEDRDIGELGPEFWRKTMTDMALPALELFTEGYLTDRAMLDEYLLYIGDPPQSEERTA